jgi:hypothetical protein
MLDMIYMKEWKVGMAAAREETPLSTSLFTPDFLSVCTQAHQPAAGDEASSSLLPSRSLLMSQIAFVGDGVHLRGLHRPDVEGDNNQGKGRDIIVHVTLCMHSLVCLHVQVVPEAAQESRKPETT